MKAIVTLGGAPLAGNSPISWRFQTGTTPYVTVMQMHTSTWESWAKDNLGKFVDLEIIDSAGARTMIKSVTALHVVPSESPHRTSFIVADRRWKWQYHLVTRDYNLPRKTGDRDKFGQRPIETNVTVDRYDYLPHSLNNGTRKWTALAAIQDVLTELEFGRGFTIESFPFQESRSEKGSFSLQNIAIRDTGDVALARLLSFMPGAEVYIDKEGQPIVFDGTDLEASERHRGRLPAETWAGESAALVDRKKVRPSKVRVHYEREVEMLLEFSDDWDSNSYSPPPADDPYVENVIPTVDQETTVTIYDPDDRNRPRTVTVPPGTWVPLREWLVAMDADKPAGSFPWTFETIRRFWVTGGLDAALGANGKDSLDTLADGNVAARVQVLKQHFRQTFQLSPRYMRRIRELRAVRAFLLDPVTGARAPASVWSQACVIPSEKGARMAASRTDGENAFIYRNLDFLAPSRDEDINILFTAPGPTAVNIVDRDLGVFRLEWIQSPFGTDGSFIPCNVKDISGNVTSPTRNYALQDKKPTGPGYRIESAADSIFLAPELTFKVMLTMVPAAPNNENRHHIEELRASDVNRLYKSDLRIQDGSGPEINVFVAPSEETMRFAWDNDEARATLKRLLGLDDPDPTTGGIMSNTLAGYIQVNEQRDVRPHAEAVAAEVLVPFADSLMGNVATTSTEHLQMSGNMRGISVQVGGAPAATVRTGHEFSGQAKSVSRFALMSEATRHLVLGIVRFQPET